MPRYEYKCKKCEKRFEVAHGIHDTVEECQFCGGPVRRVFHPVGIVFKGPGFYATDTRGGGDAFKPPSEQEKETADKVAVDEKKEDKKEKAGKKDKPEKVSS